MSVRARAVTTILVPWHNNKNMSRLFVGGVRCGGIVCCRTCGCLCGCLCGCILVVLVQFRPILFLYNTRMCSLLRPNSCPGLLRYSNTPTLSPLLCKGNPRLVHTSLAHACTHTGLHKVYYLVGRSKPVALPVVKAA